MGLFDNFKKKAEEAATTAVKKSVGSQGGTVSFTSLPTSVAELQGMSEFSLKDPYIVAGLTILCLNAYPVDKDACYAMLDAIKGPRPLTPMEKQFIRDRFMDGKDYVPRSYFVGATPENNYMPAETDGKVSIAIKENSYSRTEEGYVKLWLTSGGADSPRSITLRNKPSTGEWFLWEFNGILAGIRIPKAQDEWA